MSERIDRRIGNNSHLLIMIIVIIILAGGSAAVWIRLTSPAASPIEPPARLQPASIEEPLTVALLLPGGSALSSVATAVKRHGDAQSQAREALSAEFADPRSAQSPVLKELKLRQFFLDAGGTAYVDLEAPDNGVRASAEDEMLAVYAIVNTLTQNFEEIRQVRFLVEGREVQTLAGHIDLSRTFTKRMDLVKQ